MTSETKVPMPEPDWRELTRRLYVELWHCNRQMTTERRKWTAGPCVLQALADAKEALEANPATLTKSPALEKQHDRHHQQAG